MLVCSPFLYFSGHVSSTQAASFLVNWRPSENSSFDIAPRIHCYKHGFPSYSPHFTSWYVCVSYEPACIYCSISDFLVQVFERFSFFLVISSPIGPFGQLVLIMAKLHFGNLVYGRDWFQSLSSFGICHLGHWHFRFCSNLDLSVV